MKTPIIRTLDVLSLALLVSVAGWLTANGGCKAEDVEQAAREVQYVVTPTATSQPTTQPNPAITAAHAAVSGAAAVSPPVAQIASLVGLLAGVVAGVAGHIKGKHSGVQQAAGVITEIVGDVGTFRQPTEPWSEATRLMLEQFGHVDVAHPDPKA